MKKALVCAITLSLATTKVDASNYYKNRAPLKEKPYIELPLGAVTPGGWLKDQMERMVTGMTGNLDYLYPSVMGEANGWLGGKGHAWERGPYWIDGLVPLAYTLNNDTLKAKAQKWIEWSLASQHENGFFGPYNNKINSDDPSLSDVKDANRDWWPRMVMLKIMMQYYSATKDARVIDFMTKYFRYQLAELPQKPITFYGAYWAGARGGDNLLAVYWLYNITGDNFLMDLAKLIHKQTFNWTEVLSNDKTMSTLFSLHTVNLSQGIKEPVLFYQQAKDSLYVKTVERGFELIDRYNGWPTGLYGGDEHLHTANPTQGSELCTAVEMMYSLEKIIEITGQSKWGDLLEKITFNALPTQTTDSYDARQYYQQCNQIEISRKVRNFQVNYSGTDQLFGLLTGYPCCTANMHQGWPKFTAHLWYATKDNGAAAFAYSPCKVEMKVGNGVNIRLEEETNYPFEENINIKLTVLDKKVKTVKFPLHLRIPQWCKNPRLYINGKLSDIQADNNISVVEREWKTGDSVKLEFPMELKTSRWYENSVSIERGPLLYALKMEELWTKVKGTDKYGDYYEVHSPSTWNYAMISDYLKDEDLDKHFKVVIKGDNGKYPWNTDNAPIEIQTKARILSHWHEYNGNAGPQPFSVNHPHGEGQAPIYGEALPITLIPYGCTTLRITEFPIVR